MQVEGGVHELDEVVEGKELGAHAGLVAEEVALLFWNEYLRMKYWIWE